jgi:ribosomal protein L34
MNNHVQQPKLPIRPGKHFDQLALPNSMLSVRRLGTLFAGTLRQVRSSGISSSQFRSFATVNFENGIRDGSHRYPVFLGTNYFKGMSPIPPVLQAPYGIGDVLGFDMNSMSTGLPSLSLLQQPTFAPSVTTDLSIIEEPDVDMDRTVLTIKRTYQPSTHRRKRKHGFRHGSTKNCLSLPSQLTPIGCRIRQLRGANILERRRRKGRWRLTMI